MTSHKKFVKKQKNTVKLKGSKILPKGQNVTDTSFKVKKIVIKEQLKTHAPTEILSKRNLNIKELLNRLRHYSPMTRQDGLNGLKDVIECYPLDTLKKQLPLLLEEVAHLTIDNESGVRTSALKLLSAVLDKVSIDELSPMFPILSSYLQCAMTHLDISIREDSLTFLDTLLRATPQLIAEEVNVFLPRFINLISVKTGGSRTLSMHLDNNISSDGWRASVLFRLLKFLTALKDYRFKTDVKRAGLESEKDINVYKWENDKLFTPIYSDIYIEPMKLSLTKHEGPETLGKTDSKSQIQEYAETLIPLLLATFVEVAPCNQEKNIESQHHISVEASVLLQCIVDIILILWHLVEHCDNTKTTIGWFRKRYSGNICKRLLVNRFPYTTSQLGRKTLKNRWGKQGKALLSAVEGTIDGNCVMQNLGLSHLGLLLTDPGSKTHQLVVTYLKNCLTSCATLNNEQCVILRNCLETVFTSDKIVDSVSILESITTLWSQFKGLDRPISVMAFELLTGIALDCNLDHLHRDESFQLWLSTLPQLLTLPTIAYSTIERISQISSRNIAVFCDSLDGWIEAILDNIVTIKISGVGDEKVKEAKERILNLLYWVRDWDEEMVKNLQEATSKCFFGDLTSYVVDILQLRASRDPDGILNRCLNGVA